MKIAAKASYKAVPSILIVAPTGSTNLVTRLSTPFISSRHLNVTGSVAELKQKEDNAWYEFYTVECTLSFTAMTWKIFLIVLNFCDLPEYCIYICQGIYNTVGSPDPLGLVGYSVRVDLASVLKDTSLQSLHLITL